MDFTYEIPDNFGKRVMQYLLQSTQATLASAFQKCTYESENLGLAYYAGVKGDTWDKFALDFTFEGSEENICRLKMGNAALRNAMQKSLKSDTSGLVIRNIYYLDADVSLSEIDFPKSNEERLNADLDTAKSVLDDILQIGERVCLNSAFTKDTLENTINDYFRDMLSAKGYDEVKDQSRHGLSASGKDAGEVDILLTKNGKEICIFEGLRLQSVSTGYIKEHIDKAVTNYNALGTPTFIVAYVSVDNFESFWDKYSLYLEKYDYPLKVKKTFSTFSYPNAAARSSMVILSRDGYDFPVYFMAFKIS